MLAPASAPSWEAMHYRLVSLWDIMNLLKLGPFLDAVTSITNLGYTVTVGKFLSLPQRDYDKLYQDIELVVAQAVELDMPVTAATARETKEVYEECATRTNPGFITYSIVDSVRLAGHCKQLAAPVGKEIGGRLTLIVPMSKAAYFEPKIPIFGNDVADKFPNHTTDMFEAGNCFALGRNTACVFHLMRVMEAAVQALGAKLGVPHVNGLEWQTILEQLNAPIRAMTKGDPLRPTYSAIHSNLYHVKIAWRNEVMHPKATYDEHEAHRIINAVQAFLSDLARVL